MSEKKSYRISSVVLAVILSFVFVLSCFPLKAEAATALKIQSSVIMTSAYVGGTAKISGTTSGGTSPYTYRFLYRIGNGSWTTAKAYSSTSSVNVSLSKAGTYTFRTYAKDKKNLEVYCDMTATVKGKYVALANRSTISTTVVSLGNTLTVKGAASGGTSPYTYAYFYTPQDGSKKTFKNYSSASSVSMKLPSAGYYTVQCTIRDKDGKTSTKSFRVSVTSKTGKGLTNTSTVSSSSLYAGSALNIYGKSTGGVQPCQYAYYYSPDGISYSLISGYGKSGICTFRPSTAGYYKIKVIAKDYNGSSAVKYLSVTVKKNTNATLTNKSSVTVSGQAEKGTTVIMNAAASGGTMPYRYAYYYRVNNGSWYTVSAYSTGVSSSLKLNSVGTYTLRVDVKDEAGNISSKSFTVNSVNGTSSGKTEAVNVNYGSSTVLKAANISSSAVYSFYYKKTDDSGYTLLSSYNSTSSVSFRPRYLGSYNVVIYTKLNNKVTSKTITLQAAISSVAKSELERINAERKKAGVPALTLDSELTFAAGVRAEELAKSYSHTRPDGRSCFTVLSDYGIKYKSSVAENVAYGYSSYTSVMNAWMKSSGHKANILNKTFTKVGLGINGKYWSQTFSD